MIFYYTIALVIIQSLYHTSRAEQQWFHDSNLNSNNESSSDKPFFITIDANNTSDELNQNQSQIDFGYSGRSAKSLDLEDVYKSLSDRGREGRIINDKEISIKGFIPIMGFSNDKHDSDNEEKPPKDDYFDYQRYANHNPNPKPSHTQKHVPAQEDQRGPLGAALGATLEGLTASLAAKPSRKQGFGYQYEAPAPANGLGPNGDCICVPFYMCKNGFLVEAKNSGSKSGNIQTAQSIISQFTIPAPHPHNQRRKETKPQNQFAVATNLQPDFQQYLPLDERSTGDLLTDANEQSFSQSYPNNNNSAPQYADDVLARMLGVRSEGCGVLRTCCRPQPIPEFDFNDFQHSVGYPSGGEGYPSGAIGYPSGGFQIPENNDFIKRFTNPYQPNIQHIPDYAKPQRPHKYDFPPQRPIQTITPYPSQVVQASYDYLPKPLNPNQGSFANVPIRPLSPQIPVPLKPNYPSIQPLRPQPMQPIYPSQSSHSPQLSSQHIDSFGGYGNCGKRHAVGIHGRVQNLQYHESSTEFGEFPWQVAILKRLGPADSLYVCGGALISPNFIATAAHCLKKYGPQDLKVRLGEWDVHREDEFYPYVEKFVDDIIIHPDFFAGSLLNDIALIRLDSAVDLRNSPHIAPICLPEPHEHIAGRCFVSGWGKNAFGHQGEFQSVLTKVDLPVLNPGECEHALKRTRLGYNYQLHPSMICAGGEPGKDACDGDGGSGLVCDMRGVWKVVGLVSWGIGCGQPGIPGVYTNMAYLRPWIDSHVLRFGAGFGQQFNSFEPEFGGIDERSFAGSHNTTQTEDMENREKKSLDLNANSTTTS